LYVSAIRSYFVYHDIDVIPAKFKQKVKMPKVYREDEEPLDVSDIRKILLSCNNRRLKTILLVLASGGMRISEALAIRNMDLDFSISPTKVHLRKEFTKTKVARDIYISDEATNYLKQWLDWKNNPDRERKFDEEDLVFTVSESKAPRSIYMKIWEGFDKLLKVVKMDEKKEGGITNRKKITIHSLRRHAKTVISDQVGHDYSEWFLGHPKSPYWTKKEPEKREIYATKIMKYLTFLDYSTLETTGKNIESKLNEKDLEIEYLRQRDLKHDMEMKQLTERIEMLARQTDSMNELIEPMVKGIGIKGAKKG
jgi:integrase